MYGGAALLRTSIVCVPGASVRRVSGGDTPCGSPSTMISPQGAIPSVTDAAAAGAGGGAGAATGAVAMTAAGLVRTRAGAGLAAKAGSNEKGRSWVSGGGAARGGFEPADVLLAAPLPAAGPGALSSALATGAGAGGGPAD